MSVSALGLVQGWAVNTEDFNAVVNISLYQGDDVATGTKLTSVDAKLAGFDNNNAGNHRFEYQLWKRQLESAPLLPICW